MRIKIDKKGLRIVVPTVLVALVPICDVGRRVWPRWEQHFNTAQLVLIALAVGSLLVGTASFLSGRMIVREKWSNERLYRTLEKADRDAEVRIINSYFPDLLEFIPFLRRLLVRKGKRFKLRILLMDPNSDMVTARFALRRDSTEYATGQLRAQLEQILELEREVNESWAEARHGARETLDLKLKVYRSLMFGTLYEIGTGHLFVGLFLANESSTTGPMLELRDCEARPWRVFRSHFDAAWESGKDVELTENGELTII